MTKLWATLQSSINAGIVGGTFRKDVYSWLERVSNPTVGKIKSAMKLGEYFWSRRQLNIGVAI